LVYFQPFRVWSSQKKKNIEGAADDWLILSPPPPSLATMILKFADLRRFPWDGPLFCLSQPVRHFDVQLSYRRVPRNFIKMKRKKYCLETKEACKQVRPTYLGTEAKTIDSSKQNTTAGVSICRKMDVFTCCWDLNWTFLEQKCPSPKQCWLLSDI
jgi:hypothetical protein